MDVFSLLGFTKWPAVLVCAAIVFTAIRTPLVRRIGLRNAVRRPREALLVMLGCLLGTALIVGSGSVADSYTGSVQARAFDRLGPIDARVDYETRTNWADANARLNATPVDGVRASAAAATLEVPITTEGSATTSPRATLIEVDYTRARGLTAAAGILAGAAPANGTTWVGELMATRLGLKVGSTLTLHTKLPDQQLRVAKIVDTALVTFVDGVVRASDNLLVPPGTIGKLQAADPDALFPKWITLVQGTGETGGEKDANADALREQLTTLVAPFNGNVAMVRAESLSGATKLGKASAQFLVTISTFGIVAGLLLLVNVLLMLAEERLSELGTMRAVGMSREPLIGAFALEGAAYALVGSALGGLAGIGFGRFMVSFAAKATTATTDYARGLDVEFHAYRDTIVTGIAAGFLFAALVVIFTSYRVSRLDVIRAIRGLPAVPRRHRAAGLPLLLTGAIVGPLVGVYGYSARTSFPLLLGPLVGLLCLGMVLSRRYGYTVATVITTVPAAAFCNLFLVWNHDPNTPENAGVLAGVLQVVAGVLFVNAAQARLARGVRRIGSGRRAIPTRLGLANPLTHRVRTLLTVLPFALVVFTLVYAEGISHMIGQEVHRLGPVISGDYQIYASSSQARPYDFSEVDDASITALAPVNTLAAAFSREGIPQRLWPITAFDEQITKVAPPTLLARRPEYRSDEEAFDAVRRDPDLLIVSTNFLYSETASLNPIGERAGPPNPGDPVTIFDPVSGTARDVIVAGVTFTDVSGFGAYYGLDGAKALFGPRVIQNAALIQTSGDPAALARVLERAGAPNGLKADVIADAADEFFTYVDDIINLYRSDLGIGIVVGIAGIAVVLIRSVRDRRRQIGTLRATGVESRQVGSSFLIEGAFVTLQGLAVGTIFGLTNVMTLSRSDLVVAVLGYEPAVPAPPLTIALMAVLLLGAALAASYGPARAASRIPPAVALRLVD